MEQTNFILTVSFYRTDAGNEPVRDWLKELPRDDKRIIGEDIKTAQLGWPLGSPLILTGRHSAGFIHRRRKPDDSASWIHQENK